MCVYVYVCSSVLLCGLAPVLTTYWLNVWRERLRFRVKVWIQTSGERWERKGNASQCEVWVFETSSSSVCSCEVMMHCTLHPSCLTFSLTYRHVCLILPVTGMTCQQQRRWHTYIHKPVRTDCSRSRHCSSFRGLAQNSFIKRSSSQRKGLMSTIHSLILMGILIPTIFRG